MSFRRARSTQRATLFQDTRVKEIVAAGHAAVSPADPDGVAPRSIFVTSLFYGWRIHRKPVLWGSYSMGGNPRGRRSMGTSKDR